MSWLNGVGDAVSTACDRKQDLSLSHQTKNVHVHRNKTKVVWLSSLAIFSLCVSTSAIWHTESECFPVSSLVCITENYWPLCAKSRALTATNRLLSHCHHLSLSLPFLLCVWIKDNSHRGDPPKTVGSELRDRDVKEVEMTPRIRTSIIEMLANLCKCPEKSSYLQ